MKQNSKKTADVIEDPALPSVAEDKILEVGAIRQADDGKPEPKIKAIHPVLQTLIDNGIPLRRAIFHDNILFTHCKECSPETSLFSPEWAKNVKRFRKANMWFTPHGLVCEQEGEYKIVPLANVKDTTP